MTVIIRTHTGHPVKELVLVDLPVPGDTLRFRYESVRGEESIVTGVVESRQFDFTNNTVTLTGHWLKEAK